MRIFFLYIFPILLPTIVYLVWMKRNMKKSPNATYKVLPLPLLLVTGVILAIVIMTALINDGGFAGNVTYEKARYQDGKLIPAKTTSKEE